MSANGSQEKLGLLIKITNSRLNIIDETEQITKNVKRQTQRVKDLKKQVVTVPIIATAVGVVGSILLAGFLGRRSSKKAALAANNKTSSSGVTGTIVKILMALLIPTAKTVLVNLAKSRFNHLFTK